MGRIKLDNRIRAQIEAGIASRHRSLFVVIGDKAREQVVTLHHILAKASTAGRPSVLWCYKKELDVSSHRKKRIKEFKRKKEAGLSQTKEENLFEQFILSTHIRYCYYADSHRILGNTFGMAVLQDFEALTPNLLARTIETVEGGGLVVLLLQNLHSLKQLYTLSMDVHKRYRTEAHSEVVARFNERFILSLASCSNCVVMDDCLNVLPISSNVLKMSAESPTIQNNTPKSAHATELAELQHSLADTKPIGPILQRCRTLCQAKVLLRLLDVITEKASAANSATCSITAARGRGKSAAMGLAVAGAVGCGFTNTFVTSPSPENLCTFFEFILRGFEAIGYQEHADFEVVRSMEPELDKCITRVNVFRRHRQNIQYIHPTDAVKLDQAELVVIDEAAAIPVPLVKRLISGNYLVFLASTVCGYEGTGRSLSLKLLEQLRNNNWSSNKKTKRGVETSTTKAGGQQRRTLYELTLEESIRYGMDDPIEDWLNKTLCLNALTLKNTVDGTPCPERCELYYVNRDSLFSFHKAAEVFLANLMSIYVSAHYKNSPDDLQMMSDAPAHHLFVLMAPVPVEQSSIPQILAVIQLCLEGSISAQSVTNKQQRGKRVAGDMIPWTLCQHFLDTEFPALYGARIVRVAVHPDFQGMGYGSRAVQLLQQYYEGNFGDGHLRDKRQNDYDDIAGMLTATCNEVEVVEDNELANLLISEEIAPRANLPPLLVRLADRPADLLDYIGVAFGLTLPLLKFWKRQQFVPVYLRQSANDLTGEHSCIMIRKIGGSAAGGGGEQMEEETGSTVQMTLNSDGTWLRAFFNEFRKRFISLLGISFNEFSPHLALSLMFMNGRMPNCEENEEQKMCRDELRFVLSDLDLRRIAQYARNLADQNLITDLLPTIGALYFGERMDQRRAQLDLAQSAVLLGIGLQRKTVHSIAGELGLPDNQTYALLNKAIRRLSDYFDSICRETIEEQQQQQIHRNPVDSSAVADQQQHPAIKKMKITQFC